MVDFHIFIIFSKSWQVRSMFFRQKNTYHYRTLFNWQTYFYFPSTKQLKQGSTKTTLEKVKVELYEIVSIFLNFLRKLWIILEQLRYMPFRSSPLGIPALLSLFMFFNEICKMYNLQGSRLLSILSIGLVFLLPHCFIKC